MMAAPVPDTGWSVAYLLLGLTVVLFYAIPLTLLVETLVLRWFLARNGTPLKFWRAVEASVLMNVLSGLVGFAALILLGPALGRQWQPDAPATLVIWAQSILALFLAGILSVFIEYFPLLLFVKGKRALQASALANAASFGVLALIVTAFSLF